jgi:ABC-type oligopeptide transport system substrate-binding subunit
MPALASYWERDEDGRTYTFFLRENARFQHGRAVTAGDFVYSFKRVLRMRRGLVQGTDLLLYLEGAEEFASGASEEVPGLRAPQDHVLVLELSEPVANYPTLLGEAGLSVVPEDVVEKMGAEGFARSPVGTGPFMFESWSREKLVLKRNPDYFLGQAHLESITFDLDESVYRDAVAGLKQGSLDIAPLDPITRNQVLDPGIVRHRWENNIYYLAFNMKSEVVSDPRIRKAIALALDRARLATAEPAAVETSRTLVPRGMFGFSPTAMAPGLDREAARALLVEAGYFNDEEEPEYLDVWTTAHTNLEQSICESLNAVGIRSRVRTVHYSRLENSIETGRAAMFVLPFSFHLSDGTQVLRRLLHTRGGFNLLSYSDHTVDELMENVGGLMDSTERLSEFEDVQERLLAELPLIPLLLCQSTYAVSEKVLGLSQGPFGLASLKLEQVWINNVERTAGGRESGLVSG